MNYKKRIILLINLAVITWLLKVVFFDTLNDHSGILILGTLIFLLAFNFYAYLIKLAFDRFCKAKTIVIQILYIIFLILPIGVIWYITS